MKDWLTKDAATCLLRNSHHIHLTGGQPFKIYQRWNPGQTELSAGMFLAQRSFCCPDVITSFLPKSKLPSRSDWLFNSLTGTFLGTSLLWNCHWCSLWCLAGRVLSRLGNWHFRGCLRLGTLRRRRALGAHRFGRDAPDRCVNLGTPIGAWEPAKKSTELAWGSVNINRCNDRAFGPGSWLQIESFQQPQKQLRAKLFTCKQCSGHMRA